MDEIAAEAPFGVQLIVADELYPYLTPLTRVALLSVGAVFGMLMKLTPEKVTMPVVALQSEDVAAAPTVPWTAEVGQLVLAKKRVVMSGNDWEFVPLTPWKLSYDAPLPAALATDLAATAHPVHV